MLFRHIIQDKFLLFTLLLVCIASTADLLSDIRAGINLEHIIQETTILIIAICALILLIRKMSRQKQELQALATQLNEARNLAASAEVMAVKQQLSKIIVEQFSRWQLSKSEQEIGLLLLKGFTAKEIAALRGTAEKTIRQQASAIYQKANISGRHAFSAWFIEDFL